MLGYPVPTLIGWKGELKEGESAPEVLKFAKLSGVSEYLNWLAPDRADDLILVVDSPETWFQLRPGVLIERYYDILRKQNSRIESQLGLLALQHRNISQSIVFSTQKAEDGTEILSPGVGIGDVRSMKRLFAHALAMAKLDQNFHSEQHVLSQILEGQELQRLAIREQYLSSRQLFWRKMKKMVGFGEANVLDAHPLHRQMSLKDSARFEYGVGLDYGGRLGKTAVMGEKDAEWIRYNDTHSLGRRGSLLEDIQRSVKPFWSANAARDGLSQSTTWDNVPLYTQLQTGVVSATLQHTAPIDDSKKMREGLWDRMWFHPYGRALMDVYIDEPYRPFALLRDETEDIAWWSMHPQKWVTRTSNPEKEWLNWEELCAGDEEDLFRDGKGKWAPARMDY